MFAQIFWPFLKLSGIGTPVSCPLSVHLPYLYATSELPARRLPAPVRSSTMAMGFFGHEHAPMSTSNVNAVSVSTQSASTLPVSTLLTSTNIMSTLPNRFPACEHACLRAPSQEAPSQ